MNQAEIINKDTGEITALIAGDSVRIPSINSSGQAVSVVPPYCLVKLGRGKKKGTWSGLISQCERI